MDSPAPVAAPSTPATPASASHEAGDYIKEGKVVVVFKNTGNAPQLKQKKFKLSTRVRFQYVIDFLRKQLRFQPTDSLFLFINSTFQPHPDESVDDLFRCFHDGGKLVVNYCTQAAWG